MTRPETTRRMDRVNALLRQEVSRVLAVDLKDPRLSLVVSVTQVDASRDLRHATVLVSVLGDESQKRRTLKALKSAAGFIHRTLRQKLTIKAVPSLDFHLDESIEHGTEVLKLIDQVTSTPETHEEE